jgi:putative membrane protein
MFSLLPWFRIYCFAVPLIRYPLAMDSTYQIVLALHVIFMVTFFAGTFYIVRLFIYHKEALGKFEPDRRILSEQLALMERKLWYIITWPSLVLMAIFGTWMLVLNPGLLQQPWMHAKLGLVALLIVYHFMNQGLYKKAQAHEIAWSSFKLRLWNEGATLVLFGVVFLVILKKLEWYYGLIGLLILGAVLGMAVSMYRKRRQQANEPKKQG